MIRLITGLPGHGKTLRAVSELMKLREADDSRPLCVDGIRGLKVPYTEIDARDWSSCPDGSIIVIDEAQRIFPTRGNGAPPEHVSLLATHRHRGIDFILITQHPGNIDSFIRERLIEQHTHVMRVLGSESSMVYEWPEVQTDPRSNTARQSAITTPWPFPKAVFGMYDSAVMHTAKARLPWRKILLMSSVLLVPFLLWFAWSSMPSNRLQEANPLIGAATASTPATLQEAKRRVTTPDEWLAQYQPRIAYRPESAPAYDREMSRQRPPRVVCIDVELAGCSCYTEQATPWNGVPKDTCKRLAREGVYQPVLGRSRN